MLTPSSSTAARLAAHGHEREGEEEEEDTRDEAEEQSAPPPTAQQLERAEYLRGIVREHFSSVWRFLRRLGFEEDVVDDAAQDLFFVAARRIDDVEPGRERQFLFGAAVRIAMKMKKRRAREVPVDVVRSEDEPEETASLEERLDDERTRALLYRLLSELEDRQRIVFVMYELEGLTMQEISELLEIPPGTVASRLRSARDDFRARLERSRARMRREGGT